MAPVPDARLERRGDQLRQMDRLGTASPGGYPVSNGHGAPIQRSASSSNMLRRTVKGVMAARAVGGQPRRQQEQRPPPQAPPPQSPHQIQPKRKGPRPQPADGTDEVLLRIKDWLDTMMMRTREVFANYDADGSGQIDQMEMIRALGKLNMDTTESDIKGVFDKIAQGRGSVTLKELDRAIRESHKKVRPSEAASPRSGSPSPQRTPGPSETLWGRVGPPPKQLVNDVNQKLESPQQQFGSPRQFTPGRQALSLSTPGFSPSTTPRSAASTPGLRGKIGYFGGNRQPSSPATPGSRVSARQNQMSSGSPGSSARDAHYDQTGVPWEINELRRILKARFKTVRNAFSAMDTNGNGKVTISELGHLFDNLRIPWSEICGGRDVRTLFRVLDANGSGALSCCELFGEEMEPLDEPIDAGTTVVLNIPLLGYSKGSRVKVTSVGFDELVVEFSAGQQMKIPRSAVSKDSEDAKKPHRLHVRQHMAETREFEDQIAARLFSDWCSQDNKWATFQDLFYSESAHSGLAARREVSKDEFVKFCKQHGYKGNCEVIFREVQSECDQAIKQRGLKKGDKITFAHFKSFQWRCVGHIATLKANEWGSPAIVLVNALRHKRGTSLRGWRLDVDLRQNGRVAYVDFSNAMRKLNMSCQVKQMWNTMRPDGNAGGYIRALEFQELDPQEAAIMESFCDCLYLATGFDLEQAFEIMDSRNLKFLLYEDFFKGCQKLGYQGNEAHISCLFHGLDSRGLKKITNEDLNYLKKVSKRSQKSAADMTGQTQLLDKLILWTQRSLGGVNGLIQTLELQNDQIITSADFEICLVELGFDGDVRKTAAFIERQAGQSGITPDVLRQCLSGRDAKGRLSLQCSNKRRPEVVAKQVWKDGLFNPAQMNKGKPSCRRAYFSVPYRDGNEGHIFIPCNKTLFEASHRSLMRTTADYSSIRSPGNSRQSSPGRAASADAFRHREQDWNGNLYDASRLNERRCSVDRSHVGNGTRSTSPDRSFPQRSPVGGFSIGQGLPRYVKDESEIYESQDEEEEEDEQDDNSEAEEEQEQGVEFDEDEAF